MSRMRTALRFAVVLSLLFTVSGALMSPASAAPPSSEEELAKRLEKDLESPDATLRLWFDGVLLCTDESTRELGSAVLLATTKDLPTGWMRQSSYGQFIERLKTQAYIFFSYGKGATPENGYAVELDTFELQVADQGHDNRGQFFLLQSNGADQPRKIYLAQDDSGKWQVSVFNSVYVGVRKPEK